MQITTPPLLPPTHLIDAPGVYISPSDPVWDQGLVEPEIAALRAKGQETARLAGDLANVETHGHMEASRHPVLRYLAGRSRFQLGAADWKPDGEPCTVRDYMRPDVMPSTFLLVRPNRRRLRQVDAIEDTWERREAWIRAVVRRIDGPNGVMTWSPTSDTEEVPEAVLEDLHRWSPALVRQVADACAAYCAPLRDHEGKR